MLKLTFELLELKKPHKIGFPKCVKFFPPSGLNGAADVDSIKSFISALENYFDLVSVSDPNQYSRFAEIHLQVKTGTWFSTQNYDFKYLFWQ